MGFFSSLFGGDSRALDSSIANAGNIMNFGTNLGESDLTMGSDFYRNLLRGDPAIIGQLLGPQISGIQKRGQQQIQTEGEFGNRSGGTNAENQMNLDTQRAQVEDMISKLTAQAAGAVTNIGENALGLGLSANEAQAREGEMKLQNIINSLFGKMISGGIGAAESAGLGALGI